MTKGPHSMPLEVLHFAFVLFGGSAGGEGAEVAAFVRARVGFARVEPVFSGTELSDHLERAFRVWAALRAEAERAEAGREAAACPPSFPPLRVGEWSSGFP